MRAPSLLIALLLSGCLSRIVEGELSYEANACGGIDCGAAGWCAEGECLCDEGAARGIDGRCYAVEEGCRGCRADQICQAGACRCAPGAEERGGACVAIEDPCGGCSGRGQCVRHALEDGTVTYTCACRVGHTPSDLTGLDCAPTEEVCAAGAAFEPSEEERLLYEALNRARALADEHAPGLCFSPLRYAPIIAARARAHSEEMEALGVPRHSTDLPVGVIEILLEAEPVAMQAERLSEGGPCPGAGALCALLRCGYVEVGVGRSTGGWSTLQLAR